MLLLAGTVVGCGGEPAPRVERERSAAVDDAAAAGVEAEVGVVDLDGRPFDPLARADARAVVLLFVSTHCPIANRYAPTMRGLAAGWREQGVATYLVYPDPDDGPAAIVEHQRQYELPMPALRDPEHQLVARAEVRVTPEAAVFMPGTAKPAYHGRIDDRAVEFGKVRAEATTHELADAVAAVVAGRTPVAADAPAIGCYISDLR